MAATQEKEQTNAYKWRPYALQTLCEPDMPHEMQSKINGSYIEVKLQRPFLEDLGRSRLEKESSTWKKVKVWTDVAAAPFLEDLGRSWLEKGSSGR